MQTDICQNWDPDLASRRKFADYQTSPSLREYVLINQSQMSVECFRLSESGSWVSQSYVQGSEVYFASIDFHCDITS